ncbi:hypothetical protein DB347_03365 [Opitutaceae bacterium EW11]|nr:hypothetical protein DB347_03365 [Opitutaceae bacterium EW11]
MTATEKKPATSAVILAFATIYVVWGSTYLGIRVAVETIPPFAMASLRFAAAGAILLAALRFQGAAWPTPRQWRDNAVIGAFLLLGGNGLVAWAEQTVPSGVTALLIGVQPVFMVLTEWAWPKGQRPNLAMFVGMALGFVGVAWIAAPWQTVGTQRIDIAGALAVLAACALWAIGSIYSRHAKPAAPPFVAAAAQMLCGSVALASVALIRGEFTTFHPLAASARSWWAFTYLVLVGSLVGFSTFVWLMKHSTPARVSTYAYVNPIVAVFLGWLILKEPVSARTFFGAGIIIAAVAIVTTQKAKAQHAAAAQTPGPAQPVPARR